MKNLEQKLATLLVNDEKLGLVLWDTVKNDEKLMESFNIKLFAELLVDIKIDNCGLLVSIPWFEFNAGRLTSMMLDNRGPYYSVIYITIQDNRKTETIKYRNYRCRRTIKFILTHIINKELGIKPWTELNNKLNK